MGRVHIQYLYYDYKSILTFHSLHIEITLTVHSLKLHYMKYIALHYLRNECTILIQAQLVLYYENVGGHFILENRGRSNFP